MTETDRLKLCTGQSPTTGNKQGFLDSRRAAYVRKRVIDLGSLKGCNRCIADIEPNLHLSDQRRRLPIRQAKTPCGATSFGIAYRDARNGQTLSRVPAPVLAA